MTSAAMNKKELEDEHSYQFLSNFTKLVSDSELPIPVRKNLLRTMPVILNGDMVIKKRENGAQSAKSGRNENLVRLENHFSSDKVENRLANYSDTRCYKFLGFLIYGSLFSSIVVAFALFLFR